MQSATYDFAKWQAAENKFQIALNREPFALLRTRTTHEQVKVTLRRLHQPGHPYQAESIMSNIDRFFDVLDRVVAKCTEVLSDSRIDMGLLTGGAVGILAMSEESLPALTIITDNFDRLTTDLAYLDKFKPSVTWVRQLIRIFVALLECYEASLKLIAKHGAHNVANTHAGELKGFFRKASDSTKEAAEEVERAEERETTQVAELYTDIASMYGGEDQTQAIFPVENTPPLYNPFFLDRETELERLKTCLLLRTQPSQPKIIVLGGCGGIGKSALALQLFRECSEEKVFDAIFWVNAQDDDTMRVSFSEISGWIMHPNRSTDPEQNSMLAKTWLRTTKKSWLLIYDNLENMDVFARYQPGGHGAVVITTRNNLLAKKLEAEAVGLSRFSKEHSIVAFTHFRNIRDPSVVAGTESQEIDELVTLLDGLALGIKQIASYIGNEEWSVGEYLEKYKSMPKILLSEEDSSESHTLAKAWTVEFEDLRRKRVHACQILSILCLISAHEIPMELFNLKDGDSGVEDIFDVFEDELDVRRAFKVLETTNLIESDKKSGNIFIHRVLQVAFRYSEFGLHSRSRLQEAIKATATLLNNRFPKHTGNQSLYARWHVCAVYLSHVRSLVNAFESFKNKKQRLTSTEDLDEVLKNCCWYLYEAGLYRESIDLLRFATKHSIDKSGLHYATLCQAYACIYFELNDLPQARFWNEECLKIRQQQLDEGDPDIANVHSNLANLLTAEGRFDEAVSKVVLATRHLSLENPGDWVYIALRKMILGRAYYYSRDFTAAQKCYDESDEVFAKCKHSDQFLRSCLFHDQGNLELKRGNVSAALDKYERGYQLANEFSPSNPITGINLYSLGVTQLAQDLFEAAGKNFDDALKIAKYRGLKGQEARIYRKQAVLYERNPAASQEQKAKIPALREEALKVRDELLKINSAAILLQPQTEDETFDSLVCGYFR